LRLDPLSFCNYEKHASHNSVVNRSDHWYVVRERTNLNHQEKPWQNDSCEGLAGGENPKFLNLEQARFGALSLLTSRLGFQYLYSDLWKHDPGLGKEWK
jgi:hypothetical protein